MKISLEYLMNLILNKTQKKQVLLIFQKIKQLLELKVIKQQSYLENLWF